MTVTALLFLSCATLAVGQRPSFAPKPVGYPVVTTTEGLGDRFGEVDGTTQRLPIEAGGDRDLIDRLSKLPIDKQPFWFINWQALEANREKPQTYPQRPNTFVDPIKPNSGSTNINSVNLNSDSGSSSPSSNSGNVIPTSNSGNVSPTSNSGNVSPTSNSGNANSNSEVSTATSEAASGNRFGAEEHPTNQGSGHSNSSPEPTSTEKASSPKRDPKSY